MSTLYDYYNTGDDADGGAVDSVNWKGQTFTATSSYTLTSIKIKAYRTNNPGTMTVSLRATSSGLPTGANLVYGDIAQATITSTSAPGAWYEATMNEGYEIVQGTKYAIVMKATAAADSNIYRWRFDTTSPTYANGSQVFSANAGSSWGEQTLYDMMFETYGTGAGGGVSRKDMTLLNVG